MQRRAVLCAGTLALVLLASACTVGVRAQDEGDGGAEQLDAGGGDPEPLTCDQLAGQGWSRVGDLDLVIRDVSISIAATPVDGTTWSGPEHPHVFAAHDPEGGVVLGWGGDDGKVHLTRVDDDGSRVGEDLLVDGLHIHGLAVTEDGVAALVHRKPDELAFVKQDRDGEVIFDQTELRGGDWWQTSWWMGDGRLLWTGTQYVAYVHVSSGGHEGDTLRFYDARGDRQEGGWDWGCSHSLDQRLAFNGTRVGSACLSDCYPGQGVYFDHQNEVSREPGGDCAGSIDATLGGMAPVAGGFWLAVGSSASRDGHDIAVFAIDNDGSAGPKIWLTDTPGTEEDAAHLAAFRGGLLAGWRSSGDYLLARLDGAGEITGSPAPVASRLSEHNDFFTHPEGDVGWAYATADTTAINLVRARGCD